MKFFGQSMISLQTDQSTVTAKWQMMNTSRQSLIHSFTYPEDLYSTSPKELLRGAPSPFLVEKMVFKCLYRYKEKPFQVHGPTTEKAQQSINLLSINGHVLHPIKFYTFCSFIIWISEISTFKMFNFLWLHISNYSSPTSSLEQNSKLLLQNTHISWME